MATGTGRAAAQAIPGDVAERLCGEIRQANRGKLYTLGGLWCWFCAKCSGGNPTKMCFANGPDHRGCGQVNVRFDQSQRTAH